MRPSEVRKLSPLRRLVYWCNERQQIFLKKKAGMPPPYTDDPILAKYRFCNVRRVDDRVSAWLLANWYAPHADMPATPNGVRCRVLAAVAARHFNLPDALADIGHPSAAPSVPEWIERARAALKRRKVDGKNNFNAAYVVSGGVGGGRRGAGAGADKIDIVLDEVIRPLFDSPVTVFPDSMRLTHAALAERAGLGSFMAGQVVADLRWSVPGAWADRMTWAPQGPGSTRGLCRLYGLSVGRDALSAGEFSQLFARMMSESAPLIRVRNMEAMDYQNCLCEYDKYSRALLGEGRPKQNYRPAERAGVLFP